MGSLETFLEGPGLPEGRLSIRLVEAAGIRTKPTAVSTRAKEDGVSDKAQRRLLSLLVIATFLALDHPLKRFVAEQAPERRGPRDDVMEAVLQGAARTAAVIVASALVRQLAQQWR